MILSYLLSKRILLCNPTLRIVVFFLSELQEKKKKAEGGGGEGKGEKGKGKEDDDGEDALDWWSRYYETLKDRERNERNDDQKASRPSKKKDKREEESEEEKLKKKIPRLTVRRSLGGERGRVLFF